MKLFHALLIITQFHVASSGLLSELRKGFSKCHQSAAFCQQLLDKIPDKCSIVEKGYKAGIIMSSAKHAWLPSDKLSLFNQGKNLLESCIKAHPDNVELRYIRYCIQLNIPSFLGYDNLKTDKNFLQLHLNQIQDSELKRMIQSILNK